MAMSRPAVGLAASLSAPERYVSDGVGQRLVCLRETVDGGGQGQYGEYLGLGHVRVVLQGRGGSAFVITGADHGVGHPPIIAGRSFDGCGKRWLLQNLLTRSLDPLGVNELQGGQCWSLMQVESLHGSYEVGAGRRGCCTSLLYWADSSCSLSISIPSRWPHLVIALTFKCQNECETARLTDSVEYVR